MNGTNGNEPGYPENALVPYPVIVAATKGDPDAMNAGPVFFVKKGDVRVFSQMFCVNGGARCTI